ncbi:MAG: hypothetical protein WAM82_28695 [Thermoanaerobaculia bacterium]
MEEVQQPVVHSLMFGPELIDVITQVIGVRSPLQLTLGGRYYAEKPDGGPDWGLRFVVTFLFPK